MIYISEFSLVRADNMSDTMSVKLCVFFFQTLLYASPSYSSFLFLSHILSFSLSSFQYD